MNLGLFLAIGESFADFEKKGQESLIKNYLLKNYSKNFKKVYVFSYGNERKVYFGNVYIIPNSWNLHRYIYSLLLPILQWKYIVACDVFRGLQMTGGIPGIVSKLLLGRRLIINYGYVYVQFAVLEKKYIQAALFACLKYPVLFFADRIIVTAPYLKNDLPTFFHQKTVLIPNGVDTKVFKPMPRKKKYDVIAIGRLTPQKNFQTLIAALSETEKKLKLLIIGTGSERENLERQAKKFGVSTVFIETVPHNRLSTYLNQSRIFVLPSYLEGHPKVLLEAMSCSLPVIVSDIQAHRSIVNKGNGILTKLDQSEIAKHLLKTLRDTKHMKVLGKAARAEIVKNYSMKKLNALEIRVLKKI